MVSRTITHVVLVLVVCMVIYEGHVNGHPSKGKGKGKGKGKCHTHGGRGSSSSSEENNDDNCFKAGDGEEVEISCLHKPGFLINITEVKYGDRHEDCDPNAFDKVVQLCNGNVTCNFTVNSTNATTFDANECDASSSDELMLRIKYECIDPCKGYYCAHGGECRVETNTLRPECNCTGSWSGDRCDDNACAGVSCANGGSCRLNPDDGSALCCCATGFTGANCTVSA